MSISVSVDDSELQRLQRQIDAVLEVAQKPQLIMAQLARGIIDQTVQRIEVEKESPDGKAWASWNESYKATRDSGDSLLIDSRDLVDSFRVGRVSKKGFTIETDVIYAGVHQYGWPERNIPARPYFGVSDENARNIEEWLTSILLNGRKSAKVKQTTRKKAKRK